MLKKGTVVCHPVHGLGVIESEKKMMKVGERLAPFLVLGCASLRLMLEAGRAHEVLRRPVGPRRAAGVLERLGQPVTKLPEAKDHRRLDEALRSGDLERVADVVRELSARSREKKSLSFRNQSMLRLGNDLLVRELAHACGVPEKVMAERVQERLQTR